MAHVTGSILWNGSWTCIEACLSNDNLFHQSLPMSFAGGTHDATHLITTTVDSSPGVSSPRMVLYGANAEGVLTFALAICASADEEEGILTQLPRNLDRDPCEGDDGWLAVLNMAFERLVVVEAVEATTHANPLLRGFRSGSGHG